MHAIRHQSDAATNARLRQKQRHAEPIPQRTAYRLHNIRAIRASRRLKEALWGPGPLHSVEL